MTESVMLWVDRSRKKDLSSSRDKADGRIAGGL